MFCLLSARTLLGAPILVCLFAMSYGIIALAVKLGLPIPKGKPAPPPAPKPHAPPRPEKVYYLIENKPPQRRQPKLQARRVYFSEQDKP